VIERRIGPIRRVVARGALGSWEARGNVIGHVAAQRLGLVPVGGVATVAIGIRRCEVVIIIGVAVGAWRSGMHPGQRPTRYRVVEGAVSPQCCVVASGTLCHGERGSRCGVRRIVGLLPGGQVASRVSAIGGCDI